MKARKQNEDEAEGVEEEENNEPEGEMDADHVETAADQVETAADQVGAVSTRKRGHGAQGKVGGKVAKPGKQT